MELPKDYPGFDYATISDVILHLRYTACPGVDTAKVKDALTAVFQQTSPSNLALLISLRHDFPTEWSAFANGTDDFQVTIRRDHLPYFTQGKTITITGFDLYGQNVGAHGPAGDPQAATSGLESDESFVFTASEDAQVLTRSPRSEVFMIVRYSL